MHSRSSALARHTSCLCPTLRFSPPSATWCSRPSGSEDTNGTRWAWRSVCHRRSSSYEEKGSRLKRRVPENRTGS